MKTKIAAAALLLLVANAHSASIVSYTASANPANNPDANGQTVDAWTVTGGGDDINRSFLTGGGDWAIQYYTAPTAATHTFLGGAVSAGQSVSIAYSHGGAIDSGTRIGIRFLDASNVVQAEFSFLGGGGNGFEYGDTGNSFNWQATGKQYDADDFFTVTYNFSTGTAYSATASLGSNGGGTGAWSGSFANPVTQIQIFTDAGYNSGFSVQSFNALSIVPEPASATLGAFGLVLVGLRRRSRATVRK